MRKALVFLVILILPVVLFSSVRGRVHFTDEISYSSYNRIWVSPQDNYFSVVSLVNNPIISNDIYFMVTKNFGIGVGVGFGYQKAFFDYNRFVTIPKSLNGNISAGVVFGLNNLRISVSSLLRASFLLARNSWISQLGLMAELSYCLNNGITFISSYKYLYNYNLVSSAFSLGLGYSFGGDR